MRLLISFIFGCFLYVALVPIQGVESAIIEELRRKITERVSEIEKLDQEINEYEDKIQEIEHETVSLQSVITSLDITRRKLSTDISVTETRIDSTNLNIEALGIEILNLENSIKRSKLVLSESLREIKEAESSTLLEIFFKGDSFSEFWGSISQLESFQNSISLTLDELRSGKNTLLRAQEEAKTYKNELFDLKGELVGKKKVTDIARGEKNTLLKVTENKQSNYENLLEERKRRKAIFEEELVTFEAELVEVLDPSFIPESSVGILRWPIDGKVIITQYFGNTRFATENPSVYSGKGHNGVDIGVSRGTTIKAARSGVVKGFGDTDLTCKDASYGKWILVEHENGLSTLYAHLSLTDVAEGQEVLTGDIIGYSGNTGYSTGPHLHFTVFATDAVRIGTLKSRVCGGQYTIPLLSKTGGYLNPLSYLPEL